MVLEEAVVLIGNIADTVEASALHKIVSIRSKSVNYICSVSSAERDARANEPTMSQIFICGIWLLAFENDSIENHLT